MVSGSALAGLRLVLARAPGLVPAAQDVQLETRPPTPRGDAELQVWGPEGTALIYMKG